MNNQNRPKANYHLLATVATLGPVRGGICSDKSLRTKKCARSAKRRKGSGESGPQCPSGAVTIVTGGLNKEQSSGLF